MARLGAKLESKYCPVWYEAGSMVYRPGFKLVPAAMVWYVAITHPTEHAVQATSSLWPNSRDGR